jgi:ABC-type multidrug transport system fused ATPase/permease subunit
MDLVIPQVVARVIDEGIVAKNTESLLGLVLLTAGLIVLRGLTLFLSQVGGRYYESKIARTLRNELYDKLQRLPFEYYDRVDSGDVITVAISDSTTVKGFAGGGVMDLIRTAGIFIVIVIGMILTSVQLTLMSLVVLGLMIATATAYSRVVRPMWLAYRHQQARVTQALTENLNGIRVVKAFAMESREIEAFESEAEAMRERAMAPIRMRARLVPMLLLFTGIGTLVVVWAGGLLAIDGAISIGTLVAFYYYFTRLLRPSRMIAFIVQRLTRAAVSAERLFGLLDEPEPIASPANADPKLSLRGHVDYDNIGIAFRNREILSKVDVTIEPGKVVGVVGPTGSGKSSLLNLIPRYYDSTEGDIRLDDRPIRDFNLQGLRSQVAIVPQDPFLFSDSIHNNIAYGAPSATASDIVKAARDAQAYEFVTAMPEGFETVVGERGVGLSGGQRQRLSIARALLLNSPILILDDATSSVDTQTERRIQEALREGSTGRTTFIISQRISSVAHADIILVIDQGRVIDRGTHDELISRPGFYHDLFDLQASHLEEVRSDLSATSSTSL